MSSNVAPIPTFTLNNGRTIPVIGLGTWQAGTDGEVYTAVRNALDVGYRHLDCAFVYQNQAEIGRAIADAIKDGVVRCTLFCESILMQKISNR